MQKPLWAQTAVDLASMIRAGTVSSAEVVDAHLSRLEKLNPSLNAVVWPRSEEARAEAKAADRLVARGESLGPLHGVPVTIKECLDLTGTPSTFGIESRRDHRAKADDPYVARWRKAGAIVLGKTNVSQLLMFLESDNPVYGRTNNPWNLERSPGGSSGGEAAAIAAGFSAIGLGTDIGGSLRAPAAMCGLASLKPTAGRMPDFGRFSVPFGQQAIASQVGVLGRTVADVKLGFEAANGAPVSAGPIDLSKLTVGVFDDDGLFAASVGVQRAVKDAARLLGEAGARVVKFDPPGVNEAMALVYGLFSADGGAGFKRALGRTKVDSRVALLLMLGSASAPKRVLLKGLLGLTGRSRIKPLLACFGANTRTDGYWQLAEQLVDWRARFTQACDGQHIDALLCPPFALPALKHGATYELGLAGMYTALFNALGWPAGVCPLTRVESTEENGRAVGRDLIERFARDSDLGSAGLPLGVQLVGRPGREDVALALMAEVERVGRTRADFPRLPLSLDEAATR
jgi:fatty acid amide hydrolase